MVDLTQLKPLVARKAQELKDLCKAQGINLLITSGYRSPADQDAIYAQGRTKPGLIVTQAKGGQSLHNYGVAIDCVPLVGGKPCWNEAMYEPVTKIALGLGFEHGDRGYKDIPHYQIRLGYSLQDFQTGKVEITKFN